MSVGCKRGYALVLGLLLAVMAVVLLGCGVSEEVSSASADGGVEVEVLSNLAKTVSSFAVRSDSVTAEGKLKTKCCFFNAEPQGENLSPQLSWDAVEGANYYAIYMYDADALAYVHWKVADLEQTTLDEGAMQSELMYVGPVPPGGTHNYQITVYAMKKQPTLYAGELKEKGDVDAIEAALDEVDGEQGNVIGVGVLAASVTYGETVE